MQVVLIIALTSLAVGCAKHEQPAAGTGAEITYAMTATVISRDPGKNMLNLDNQEVPGKMAPMKMDYEVRGARVESLPRDGAVVVVTVHDTDGAVYITDVKSK
ncbi:MAG: hypothetical protein NVSMB68_10310 [Thermoanaerobaculia bacterium]